MGRNAAWAGGHGATAAGSPARGTSRRRERLLRVGFGILWVFDGILQAQPQQMAGGLPQKVIKPAAATSPAWVQHLVNWRFTCITPIPPAPRVRVSIQVGIGMWLIFAPRGWASRLAGLASVAWGLVVWAFGEAFSRMFAPGLTVCCRRAGSRAHLRGRGRLDSAARARLGDRRRTGRLTLGGTGLFLLGISSHTSSSGRMRE